MEREQLLTAIGGECAERGLAVVMLETVQDATVGAVHTGDRFAPFAIPHWRVRQCEDVGELVRGYFDALAWEPMQ